MADDSSSSTPWLAFLIGGLIVAVAVIAFVVYSGGGMSKPQMPSSVEVDVNLPKAPPIPDAPQLPNAPIPTPK
ncbi:hypothetical protein [Phenylobacterium sp.]|uniref:hypothetical protein n=1 Tax=Phenylobacterium sp. TaxID=1871053 RepID=UPI00273360E0|nr:hypothetical protein [Phenylobacterium sp.]MDP3854316.1 hypothetical protein [Phenylobacterium sp.]